MNFSIKKEVAASPLVIIEDKSKIYGKKKEQSKEAKENDDKKE